LAGCSQSSGCAPPSAFSAGIGFGPAASAAAARRAVKTMAPRVAPRLAIYAPSVVPEAPLQKTEVGSVANGEGWFVLNARDVSWIRSEERGQDTDFEGRQEWTQLGFRIHILMPGQRNGMYHGERAQEDFLVVSGECVLVIEGEERCLKAWDFVHCPPWTQHVFVGTGDGPCVIVMAGSRLGGFEVMYTVNEVAAKHGASVPEETSKSQEAYTQFGPEERSAYREGWLP
jgi:uncharacterized cupin superfamily protein